MAQKKLAMKGKSHATTEATETALRLFESVHGQRPLVSITRREVADWIELLQRKPIRPDKEHRSLGLKEMVALYADRPEVPRLTGKSVNGHLSHLSSIWSWARQRGHIERLLDNPFSEQRVEEKMPPADEGFTPAQLQAIFNLPIFTQGERPAQGRGETSYWLPLLLLSYGNRPEEMCQLLVSDIFFNEDEGIWCLRITDEGEHPVKGSRHIKADGNPVIRRTLPVAKRLLDLGFIDYVEGLKTQGQLALFPKLTIKGKRGYLHTSFAPWWGKYLREHGAIPEAGNKPLRGFRDAWTTAAARSGLTEEEREWIQGHYVSKGKTSNRRYGVRDFGSKIDEVNYKGLDLSHLRPWVRG
jgi:integrase